MQTLLRSSYYSLPTSVVLPSLGQSIPITVWHTRSQKGRQLSSHSLAELRTMVVDAREAARKTIKAAATAYPAPYK